ncbi:Fluconazole resistance protein [Lachnellula suecica]|uniref:Fluconazole resistance protein n=1 Tax=Lachnellula suecica TaxID=602035 RepID=A0A8T9CBS2_9HELO|nr:Fluconazole resistance protein [Lachnellula suecica]
MTPALPVYLEESKFHTLPGEKSLSKNIKKRARSPKRTASSPGSNGLASNERHKRVRKACERCRIKKTKGRTHPIDRQCDGGSPCKKCGDDGLVCVAGRRVTNECKQLPQGYAEFLENTQYTLIAIVQALYLMVRNGDTWELGEPEMNDRGVPVIHDIAKRLNCIPLQQDVPSRFSEDVEDHAEVQAQMCLTNREVGEEIQQNLLEDGTISSKDLELSNQQWHNFHRPLPSPPFPFPMRLPNQEPQSVESPESLNSTFCSWSTATEDDLFRPNDADTIIENDIMGYYAEFGTGGNVVDFPFGD